MITIAINHAYATAPMADEQGWPDGGFYWHVGTMFDEGAPHGPFAYGVVSGSNAVEMRYCR